MTVALYTTKTSPYPTLWLSLFHFGLFTMGYVTRWRKFFECESNLHIHLNWKHSESKWLNGVNRQNKNTDSFSLSIVWHSKNDKKKLERRIYLHEIFVPFQIIRQKIDDDDLKKMDLQDMDGIDSDKFVIFQQDDLHVESFPLMKEIRRQGKLCDVTLKVS